MPAPEKFKSVLKEPEELLVVLPNAVRLCVCTDCVAEIVALPAPTPTLTMPAPDRLNRFENVPEELDVVFPKAVREIEEVWIAGEGTEIVTLPAPTPTEAMPAPEKFSRFENVPEELLVVFPSAVIEIDEVCTEAEMVIVLPACPVPMPAPAEIETLLEVPFNEKLVAAGTVGPTMVIACSD